MLNMTHSVTSGPGKGGNGDATGSDRVAVRIRGLVKRFVRTDGTEVMAIDHSTLDIHAGEFVVLLGPSGCGKTTLLRSIAGLERPDAGEIEIAGVTHFSSKAKLNTPPERRGLSMIFQSYALWPHMSIVENVAYPLESRRGRSITREQIRSKVHEALALVGIDELATQYPGRISGGQQQRVALARALVAGDDLILFDEPLSNVDAKVREQLRTEMLRMQQRLGFAAVYVTHDQAEAMAMADRIVVMDSGQIVQVGSPQEIYDRPANRYVANFVGTLNEVSGVVRSFEAGTMTIETALGALSHSHLPGVVVGDRVVVAWRPEKTVLSLTPTVGTNWWSARLENQLFGGHYVESVLATDEGAVRAWHGPGDFDVAEDGVVWFAPASGATHVFQLS